MWFANEYPAFDFRVNSNRPLNFDYLYSIVRHWSNWLWHPHLMESWKKVREQRNKLSSKQTKPMQFTITKKKNEEKINYYFEWVFPVGIEFRRIHTVKNKYVKFALHSILSHNWVISSHWFSRGKFRPSRSIYAWHKFPNCKTAATATKPSATAAAAAHLHRMMPPLATAFRYKMPISMKMSIPLASLS